MYLSPMHLRKIRGNCSKNPQQRLDSSLICKIIRDEQSLVGIKWLFSDEKIFISKNAILLPTTADNTVLGPLLLEALLTVCDDNKWDIKVMV